MTYVHPVTSDLRADLDTADEVLADIATLRHRLGYDPTDPDQDWRALAVRMEWEARRLLSLPHPDPTATPP